MLSIHIKWFWLRWWWQVVSCQLKWKTPLIKSNLSTNRISTNKTRWFMVQVQRFAWSSSVLLIKKAFCWATLNQIWWKSKIAEENSWFSYFEFDKFEQIVLSIDIFNVIQTVYCSFLPIFVYFDEFVYGSESSGAVICFYISLKFNKNHPKDN